MNIFILDYDRRLNAEYYCDKHVVKIITEISQMLSMAIQLYSRTELPPYIMNIHRAHLNHPVCKWVRNTVSNFKYTNSLLIELLKEYQYRYNNHKAFYRSYLISKYAHRVSYIIPKGNLTPFVLAMPDKYKTNDAVESYRNYYINEKLGFATWKKRGEPEWIKSEIIH